MIGLDVKAHGLEEVVARLKMLREEFGSRLGGVVLYAVARKEGGKDNVAIAESLAFSKYKHAGVKRRDFFGVKKPLPQEDQQRIANAFMARFNATFTLPRPSATDSFAIRAANRKEAQDVAGGCLREAMQTYMAIVSQRIADQNTVDGVLDPLSEEYADWKEHEYGFRTPIGVATGQLLENINPYNAGRNIKLTGGNK